MASVIAEVRGTVLLRTRSMPIFEMTVGQNLSTLKCMWFHGTYLEGKFKPGQMVALYGKVEPSRSTRNFKMIQPQFEILPEDADDETRLLEVGRITPVYESLSGSRLASRWIRRIVYNLLQELRGICRRPSRQRCSRAWKCPAVKRRCARCIFLPREPQCPICRPQQRRRISASSLRSSSTLNADWN